MRIMIAGTSSGCGKTTVSLALMGYLVKKGYRVAPFKSGPDYIDPGFHRLAAGRPSHNLDLYMMSEAAIRQVLALGMENADIGVIEGAMSFYDGIGSEGACSAWALSEATKTPVLLVVDASGSASGCAATVLGFQMYEQPSNIAGVIVNRVSTENHYNLIREAIEHRTGLKCVGYMKKDASVNLNSRHLGLIPAEEVADFQSKLEQAIGLLSVDEEALFSIAKSAAMLETEELKIGTQYKGFRMGVARDAAFSFYYEANLEMLRRMGMELVWFSPLNDPALPEGLNGLYLGGGFPEVFKEQLSENKSMLVSIKQSLSEGLRCYAECGGMMYLTQSIDGTEMAGVFPIRCEMTKRLQRFGYVEVRDEQTGIVFRAHEFHHSLESGDEALTKVYFIKKASDPNRTWTGGYRTQKTLAGYPHIHFWGNEELVKVLWNLDGE